MYLLVVLATRWRGLEIFQRRRIQQHNPQRRCGWLGVGYWHHFGRDAAAHRHIRPDLRAGYTDIHADSHTDAYGDAPPHKHSAARDGDIGAYNARARATDADPHA